MNRSSRGETFLLVVVMMLLSYLNSCVLSIELFVSGTLFLASAVIFVAE